MNEMIKCWAVYPLFKKKFIGSFKKHAVNPQFNFVICQNFNQRHTYDTDYLGSIKFRTWSDELLTDYYQLL